MPSILVGALGHFAQPARHGIIPEVEIRYQPPYEDESESWEGGIYTGKEIIESGIIEEVEKRGYIHWLVGEIKINPILI